jgi:hypothetical protein
MAAKKTRERGFLWSVVRLLLSEAARISGGSGDANPPDEQSAARKSVFWCLPVLTLIKRSVLALFYRRNFQ